MKFDVLTKQELNELEAAGVRYPWHPGQTLHYIKECEALNKKLVVAKKENSELKDVIRALELLDFKI